MERVNSNYCVFIIIFSQVTSFLPMGLNLAALNPSAPAISDFINESHTKRYGVPASEETVQLITALAQSMLTIGAAVAAILVRISLVNLSRRSNLVLSHLIAILSALLMSPVAKFGRSYEALIAGRFLNGFSRGMAFTITPIIVAETTSRKTLALYQTPTTWLILLGAAIGNALAHPDVLGGVTTWPYLLVVPGLFSLMYLCCLSWIPQTPTYLILEETTTDGISNDGQTTKPSFLLLKKLRLDHVDNEYQDIKDEIEVDKKIEKATLKEIFNIRQYRRQLFGATIVMLSMQATGMQALLQYSNKILETAGIDQRHSTLYTIGIFALLTITIMLCTPLLARFGSKKMILIGLCIVVLSLVLLTVTTVINSSVPSISHLSVASLALFVIGTACGPHLSVTALTSEITTHVTRPTILWIAGICYWLAATIIVFTTPYALNGIGGYTYLIFIAAMIATIAYVKLFIPNTQQRTVQEIQQRLKDKKAKRTSQPTSNISVVSTDRLQTNIACPDSGN